MYIKHKISACKTDKNKSRKFFASIEYILQCHYQFEEYSTDRLFPYETLLASCYFIIIFMADVKTIFFPQSHLSGPSQLGPLMSHTLSRPILFPSYSLTNVISCKH